MKTPDESKCGLECMRTNAERICVKPENGQCPRCEQLVEKTLVRIHMLESTYSQVSKALCGKENATLDELLQAASQVKSRLAQVERERAAAVAVMAEAAKDGGVCTGCKHNTGLDDACEAADFDCNECKVPCMCRTCEANSNYERRGV